MSNIWEEYKHIRCGDFLRWWSKKTVEEKQKWNDKKEKLDLEIEQQLWERELRRKF
tara:strand:+ start:241 stop:408 length:168 start_codon:yes stop_codon:yes gene_type:complete